MRVAGRLASDVLVMIESFVKPGISTEELDKICHDFIVNEQKAIPAPLNYKGFPKSICTSVNHQVCHGILVTFDGTDNFRLTDELYEAVCNATKLLPQRAIMAAHFLNYEAYELYTINGNKIDETYVKWDKEKNKCFAGYTVSGANVGVNKTANVSGEVLSFLSTGIDTRVYFIKNF